MVEKDDIIERWAESLVLHRGRAHEMQVARGVLEIYEDLIPKELRNISPFSCSTCAAMFILFNRQLIQIIWVNNLEVLAKTTAEAWEKLSLSLLNSGEESTVHNEPVTEIRWLSIHVLTPLQEPRINERFDEFCSKIHLGDDWRPENYLLQVTKQTTKGYWWEVYGNPIWEEIPKLEAVLRENPSYNKPSITVRNSKKHLRGKKTPCLVYITFQIRNEKLDLGVHFDTNAIEFIQSNMYGLTELQKIVAEELGVITGTYHHFVDSLFVNKKHFVSLKETFADKI